MKVKTIKTNALNRVFYSEHIWHVCKGKKNTKGQ